MKLLHFTILTAFESVLGVQGFGYQIGLIVLLRPKALANAMPNAHLKEAMGNSLYFFQEKTADSKQIISLPQSNHFIEPIT